MPDQSTHRDVPSAIGFALDELVRRAAHAMEPEHAFAEPGEALAATPAQCRADDLARLRAIEALHSELTVASHMLAHRAGGRTDAPVTYAELGSTAGITRQAARERWPGAVPDAKPGRPRKQVAVRLEGGPVVWDGAELAFDRVEVYDRALEDVGAYLITPDAPALDGPPEDSRAHYAPKTEDTRNVWTFQGWVPS